MGHKHDDIVYLEIMHKAVQTIFEYLGTIDEDGFLRNDILKDACLMQLILLGENGGKVSQQLRDRFNEVEWQQIKAARNFFVHAYEYIDWVRVWNTIVDILPTLKMKIESIIQVLENN